VLQYPVDTQRQKASQQELVARAHNLTADAVGYPPGESTRELMNTRYYAMDKNGLRTWGVHERARGPPRSRVAKYANGRSTSILINYGDYSADRIRTKTPSVITPTRIDPHAPTPSADWNFSDPSRTSLTPTWCNSKSS
jgi:hypothetical protein